MNVPQALLDRKAHLKDELAELAARRVQIDHEHEIAEAQLLELCSAISVVEAEPAAPAPWLAPTGSSETTTAGLTVVMTKSDPTPPRAPKRNVKAIVQEHLERLGGAEVDPVALAQAHSVKLRDVSAALAKLVDEGIAVQSGSLYSLAILTSHPVLSVLISVKLRGPSSRSHLLQERLPPSAIDAAIEQGLISEGDMGFVLEPKGLAALEAKARPTAAQPQETNP